MAHYKEFVIPVGEVKQAANPSSERKDLLSGLPLYGVKNLAPITEHHKTNYFNTFEENFTLTDGVDAVKPDYLDPAFTHFSGGTEREIVYSLGSLCAVDGFKLTLLRQVSVGVGMPYILDISLSENGKDWQCVSSTRRIPTDESEKVYTVKIDFGKCYKAAWVKLRFDLSLHVWLENFNLFGTTAIPADALSIVADPVSEKDVGKFASPADLCDTHNIALLYNCFPPDFGKSGQLTEEEALRYVGYYDKEGNLKDTFLDGFLMLPYVKFCYSKWYKCGEGWRFFIDKTFEDHFNVDALEYAASEVSKGLGREVEAKLFLTVLHTNAGYGEHPDKFGELDGRELDMSKLEDRKFAVKWCIDEQIARYKEKARPHTKLCGFYWFEEGINYNDPLDPQVIRFTAEYLHSLGYKLFWIPYYQAWGYQNWKELGFDVGCMQPNYAFHMDEPIQRLYDNAELCKKFGLAYEIELAGIWKEADIKRYKEYLDVGAETGYMDSIKMYYQDGRAFYAAAMSQDPLAHSVYDDTYLFAKEKYHR